MGADLYIKGKSQEWHDAHIQAFNDAIAKRDSYHNISKEHERIQKEEVSPAYNKLYSENPYYFRDSYNDSSVLWMLKLSWWNDSKKFLNEDREMTPEQSKLWLELLKSKEPELKANIESKVVKGSEYVGSEETVKEARNWYYSQYKRMIEFFERAIELNLNVEFSI